MTGHEGDETTVRIDDRWVARLEAPTPLTFVGPGAAQDLPDHVRAGSGLRRWGERLVVVQDDVNALAILDERTGSVAALILPAGADGRRRFGTDLGNKALKMDLEACVVLPDGRLVALGSGSTPERERIVVVDEAHGVRLVDGAALYAALRARRDFAGSELNIEGAVVVAGRLRLLQRGNGAMVDGRVPVNAIGDLDLPRFARWLDGAAAVPELVAVLPIELGAMNGVPLGFTDATTLQDGRVVFLAGAESSPDTFEDGAIVGCRIGVVDGEHVVMTDILDPDGAPTRLKLEGIDGGSVRDDGALEFVVVADMDDPDVPAALAHLVWSRG